MRSSSLAMLALAPLLGACPGEAPARSTNALEPQEEPTSVIDEVVIPGVDSSAREAEAAIDGSNVLEALEALEEEIESGP